MRAYFKRESEIGWYLKVNQISAKMTKNPFNLILIYLLTTIGLTPGGSSTAHIYTKTIHKTTQLTTLVNNTINNLSAVNTNNELYRGPGYLLLAVYYCGDEIRENYICGICGTYWRGEIHSGFCYGNLKESLLLVYLDVGWSVTLQRILNKKESRGLDSLGS